MQAVLVAGLKGLAAVVAVGVIAGTTVYTQSSSIRLSVVAALAASAAEVLRELIPAGVGVKVAEVHSGVSGGGGGGR